MLTAQEFLVLVGLDKGALKAWVEAGWLTPDRQAAAWRFSEIDLGRARLILDLKDDLGVNDEGIGVVLDLVDQMHGLRRILGDVLAAASAQPEPTRRRMAAALQASAGARLFGHALPPQA
jgi:chaperone modulatory protein CbpM